MRRLTLLLGGFAALVAGIVVASVAGATKVETRWVLAHLGTLMWRLGVAAVVFALSLTPAGVLIDSGEDQARSGVPSLPSYSRDGRWLSFTSDRSGKNEVYVARVGGEARQISHSEHGVAAHAWSPDGSRIVFNQLTGGDWWDADSSGLFIVDRDGSGQRQVTTGDDYTPCWAADGETIVFVRDDRVYAIGADGTERRLLARNAFTPACSPTRPTIAVADGASIQIIDLDRGSTQTVVPSDAIDMSSPAWSLDGKKVAFEASRPRVGGDPVIEEGPWAAPWYFAEIYVVNADGSALEKLTGNSVGDRWPSWTPDGRILFVSNRAEADDLTNSEASEYYVMNADGSGVKLFRWDPSYS